MGLSNDKEGCNSQSSIFLSENLVATAVDISLVSVVVCMHLSNKVLPYLLPCGQMILV